MKKEKGCEISNNTLTKMLNKSIGLLIEDFIKIAISDFSSAKNIIKIALKQKGTGSIRNKYEERGLHVPPFMIASITSKCNLKCKGCYDREKSHNCSLEFNENQWTNVFHQAKELGMSFILLAGGEPLTKTKVIRECVNFPEIIFPMFTNGMLINEEWVEYFASCRNLIPIISIEGDKKQTDNRRGEGVFDRVSLSFELLKKRNIFYGISITLTSENYDSVINENFIKDYMDKGCRAFFFIEHVPFDCTTESIVISKTQREELDERLGKLRKKYKGIFIAFPGDEKRFGGCLAAGRGFIHINSRGAVEACPFAPYSDVNLNEMSLKEALSSPLLGKIRNIHGLLDEHKGGCALFENKEVVERVLKDHEM
ncbi:radical SAM protein [Oceanirhabdus sp. W0125-5]|uniref:radical SAM protein n=1 Tax=Oceanirhabdus sp. W0125-5 TaxID=2999116 RepID=UPI0022F32DDC|nr:radical SAM protein [Oceanirhabdus sp. W0125-5]WBW97166.1 radical SAM protein [Oceanirhabdus sp. W0125-5]